MTKNSLTEIQREIMRILNSITGLDDFILYGGAAIELLSTGIRISDYDLAYKGYKSSKLDQCVAQLINCGFKITQQKREYLINMDTKVRLVYCETKDIKLDIAFLDSFDEIGQFDIGSLYWKYPEMSYIDKHGAIEAYRNKTVSHIRGFDSENPFLITRSFLKLCSKYDLDMKKTEHIEIIDQLKIRLSAWQDKVDNSILASTLAAIYSSILRAKNSNTFVRNLLDTELLTNIAPKLEKALKKTENENQINNIINRTYLIEHLSNKLNSDEKKEFLKEQKVLDSRSWE